MTRVWKIIRRRFRAIKIKAAQTSFSALVATGIMSYGTARDHSTDIFANRVLGVLQRRLHVVSPQQDFDVTYIKHGQGFGFQASHIHLMDVLSDVTRYMSKWIDGYTEFCQTNNPLLGQERRNGGQRSENLSFKLFSQVPELDDTQNHYLFLHALVSVLGAKKVLEVGTASGASLGAFLSSASVEFVDTFDVLPLEANTGWLSAASRGVVNQFLLEHQNRWQQHISDLSRTEEWDRFRRQKGSIDLVLVDAVHSGSLEDMLARKFARDFVPGTIVIWDDIRVSSMVHFWECLKWPKLDLGSVGHNSGTGLSIIPS